MRAIAVVFAVAALAPGQGPRAPVFEAASIKPGDPASPETSWNTSTGRITIQNMPLRQLIMFAYDVKEYQVLGGPKWADTDGYSIVAKLEDTTTPARGRENDARLRNAARVLLADRFRLAVHRETKDMPGYALVVAKIGFKLKPAENRGMGSSSWGGGKATFRQTTIASFAGSFSTILDRPVVDRTGIEGVYDLKLEWSPDDRADSGPSVFTALQEQVGLKLEAGKVPVEMIIIDRAEKPSDN